MHETNVQSADTKLDYAQLIARLEMAPEGSRELDYEIFAFLNPLHGPLAMRDRWEAGLVRLYTTSVDAALTLVPEGMEIHISTMDAGVVGAHAFLFGPSSPAASDVKCWGEVHLCAGPQDRTTALPLALALCIAALKAMASA